MMTKKDYPQHWCLEQDAQGITWLGFDYQNSSANVLSSEALEQLDEKLDEAVGLSARALVIYSLKANAFIMGADVKSFDKLETVEQANALIDLGHRVCDKLDALSIPTIAMISGHCLGGGLELSLCCDVLIACSDKNINLGLPEVKLGIHPGFGGTVRLVERLGPLPALQPMLSGRNISVNKAKGMGLLDAAVPTRQLKRAAVHFATHSVRKKRTWMQRIHKKIPIVFLLLAANMAERALNKKVIKAHYPAPYRMLDLWRGQLGKRREKQLTMEKESISALFFDETSRNLVRVFNLRGKLTRLGTKSGEAAIRRVHVIGAGVMGGDIATWCAAQGMTVTLQDTHLDALGRAKQRSACYAKRYIRQQHACTAMLDRILIDPGGMGLKQAELVIEAVIEDVGVKRKLFHEVEAEVGEQTLIATNTSSIPLDELSEGMQHPQRFLGLHFFNPVTKMPLVEVIAAATTADNNLSRAYQFVHAIKRLPLPVKSSIGFLVNRILMAYLVEAVILVDEGVPPVSIDREAKKFGMPMGPIELADKVGLDVCHHVLHVFGDLTRRDTATDKALRYIDKMVNKGKLGLKSNAGFYLYKKGKKVVDKGAGEEISADVGRRLFARFFNESIACMEEGVVEHADFLDAGMIFGTGFAPFTSGPMHYLQTHAGEVYADLVRFSDLYGMRFAPHEGWKNRLGV